MTVDADDGGTASPSTDDWSIGGAAALSRHAPAVAASFARLLGVRPSGVFDELLRDPTVAAYAERFGTDVTGVDEPLRAAFATATGERQLSVAQMVWIGDVGPRVHDALDALFGASDWTVERRVPVTDVGSVIDEFVATVARLAALDVTTTELVRLRGARVHGCRLCASRRSAAAVDAGADEVLFAAVDDHAASDLPSPAKAALVLTDAVVQAPPVVVTSEVLAAVRTHLTPAQTVEVVLDVARNSANKIAVALGADAPDVTDGVQLFTTDADGVVSTL